LRRYISNTKSDVCLSLNNDQAFQFFLLRKAEASRTIPRILRKYTQHELEGIRHIFLTRPSLVKSISRVRWRVLPLNCRVEIVPHPTQQECLSFPCPDQKSYHSYTLSGGTLICCQKVCVDMITLLYDGE
jgi:hypothetical protein